MRAWEGFCLFACLAFLLFGLFWGEGGVWIYLYGFFYLFLKLNKSNHFTSQ